MKERTFEEALGEVENLISELEEGNIPLKKSIVKFNESVELLKFCQKELKDAELSVQKLIDKDGKLVFEDFDTSKSDSA